jgi:NAD(P)-dependent dehydrogenase (short-subunit alcohol dehydrogenase family)
MLLKGKSVLITGAGRGIGRAIALECASEGGNIILLARTHSELQNTAAEISRLGGASLIFVCDISSPSKVDKAVSSAKKEFGEIDVLVNNAGIQPPIGPFSDVDLREWKTNIGINLFGTANVISAVLPGMIARKKGKIINLSGGGSTSPRPNFSAYAVSKTAIVRFTETLAVELSASNIDVNAISPGAVNTNMLDEVLLAGSLAGKEADDARKRKEVGGDDPELAAELVCFLASDESDGITGKLISARWDPWKKLSFREKLRTDKDFATLRRIDDKYFAKR